LSGSDAAPTHGDAKPVAKPDIRLTLRRIAGGARLVGLGWMLALVLVALIRDPLPNPVFAWVLAAAAVVWGLLTGADQLRVRESDPIWITVGDAFLASYAILAPEAAGTTDLFYGGFPGIAVVTAAVRGRRWGWMVAGVLSAVTLVQLGIADLSDVLSRLSQLVAYVMLAGIVGWAVHVIHQTDAARRLAEDAEARAEEKSRVAAHLHDSVLQTLALIQRESADSARVVALARGQERDLRDWLFGATGLESDGLADAIRRVAAEIEDSYRVKVEVVAVGEASMHPAAQALVGAGREAMINAAKHSGADSVSVYVEADAKALRLFVRDRGVGFDPAAVAADRRGLHDSITRRVAQVGGSSEVRSSPGQGTEIRLEVPN
jgi:signal transduction histidine kinase